MIEGQSLHHATSSQIFLYLLEFRDMKYVHLRSGISSNRVLSYLSPDQFLIGKPFSGYNEKFCGMLSTMTVLFKERPSRFKSLTKVVLTIFYSEQCYR